MAGHIMIQPQENAGGDGAAGIMIQTEANRENSIGLVVKVSPGNTEYEVGMRVVYRRVTATDIKLFDEKDVMQAYKIVNTEDVIAIIDNEESGL